MDLDRAQANWTLGHFNSEELPELAAQMMMQGFEGPAILELASFHRPINRDIPKGLVERAFLETGRPSISVVEASSRLSEPIAQRIVSGSTQPLEGALELLQGVRWAGESGDTSFFYQLDDLAENAHRPSPDGEKCSRKIVDVCRQFLNKRSQGLSASGH